MASEDKMKSSKILNKERSSQVIIDDIPLSCLQTQTNETVTDSMVSVPSWDRNVRSVAVAVSCKIPVLLEGPVGCGKTALVEHLAQVTGRHKPPHLIKIQLGDQTDSKLLLGSYRCSNIPGEFIWQPGSLTQAVKYGYWILFEDIDYAPADVLTVLDSLLELKSLSLPGHGDTIKAADNFQIFATRRTMKGSHELITGRGHSILVNKYWAKFTIEPLTTQELEKVIIERWPKLKSLNSRIREAYCLLSSTDNGTVDNQMFGQVLHHSGRLISTRDLFKWCSRISKYFNLTSQDSAMLIFENFFDCFCCCIPLKALRYQVAGAAAAKFGISKHSAEYYCTKHKPIINTEAEMFIVGRAKLSKKKNKITNNWQQKMTRLSFTRSTVVLLEKIAVAVENKEPVLLVGETGTGKTSTIQFLSENTGHKLIVINMSQQSDSTDLLGGFKPMDVRGLVSPVRDFYEEIFCETFSRSQNAKFLAHIANCFNRQEWDTLFKLMLHTRENALKKFSKEDAELQTKWNNLAEKIKHLQIQIKKSALAFSFVEGSVLKALQEGHWLLLDEINLAAPETLECLSSLLESTTGSILMLDKGDLEPIPRHPDFHLFACMNPATDVGKTNLLPGIRNRFTEFFVDELDDAADLNILIADYLQGLSLTGDQINNITQFYLHVRKEATNILTDGTGYKPHYSLRTLCRALSYASLNLCGASPRSLYEAFSMSFLTQLDKASSKIVEHLIVKYILKNQNVAGILNKPLPMPTDGSYFRVEGYWIPKGSTSESTFSRKYILTQGVRHNLCNLCRIISAGKHPVLLQGDTSVGKTTLIQYVASLTNNHCVRINNHEHTDLQEYIGTYGADHDGKLTFKEGVLVNAMRKGYWIILDELNLAPTEVLEALNRVLDDNRELFISETQVVVKAHPHFRLFATQNPPGYYGGRKALSRAFRNRFIELHFTEIPPEELEVILHKRCDVPLSYCKRMVAAMVELQRQRSGSSIFAGKQSLITLRDLFRWGERYRLAEEIDSEFYDWDRHLAEEGYLLLAGRSRKFEECEIIREILGKHLLKKDKRKAKIDKSYSEEKINCENLFTLNENTSPVTSDLLTFINNQRIDEFSHVVWTPTMCRLAVLVGKALHFKEPVLLVGETGTGKTTICQMFAKMLKKSFYTVNCHMHSESGDFLGSLRPVRHHLTEEDTRLFEWVDGPLVKAMTEGCIFLVDEISLADDSVLERLNSILEPERNLLLAEKVAFDNEIKTVTATDGFQFLATMNPGGDYGKRELSPALRNRFTEIWCPTSSLETELRTIIAFNLKLSDSFEINPEKYADLIVEFIDWIQGQQFAQKVMISIRDILSWVHFMNSFIQNIQEKFHSPIKDERILPTAYVHGAFLIILDSLGSTKMGSSHSLSVTSIKEMALNYLMEQLKIKFNVKLMPEDLFLTNIYCKSPISRDGIISNSHIFGISPFFVEKGPIKRQILEGGFSLLAPTTYLNAHRILRALQLSKPILLEGSPGVGKTTLVTALAKSCGYKCVRINLSEQTDISDLFGADLPVEGGRGGSFAWRDGPFLQALKDGHWIIFDEMNLASQSVLEGLNACLDHRGEIFVPELNCTFQVARQQTRIFACQNPFQQGGGRKGLPASFLNRFTQVYIEQLTSTDYEIIIEQSFPMLPREIVSKMVEFNNKINEEVGVKGLWGTKGSPWEFNLRDIFRWAEVMISNQGPNNWDAGEYVSLIFKDRMRTLEDKKEVLQLYQTVFGNMAYISGCELLVTEKFFRIGHSVLQRLQDKEENSRKEVSQITQNLFLSNQLEALESVMKCIQMKWMTILVGSKSCGKTTLLQLLALITGHKLKTFALNSSTDSSDLLGGFEQVEFGRHVENLEERIWKLIQWTKNSGQKTETEVKELKKLWLKLKRRSVNEKHLSMTDEAMLLKRRVKCLKKILKSLPVNESIEHVNTEKAFLALRLKEVEKEITKQITEQGSGGRFEWIDSVLIEALQQGHWLVLDNVNFCSPSVLDRLNGLLEPNGVLQVSERGVIDGQIPTIIPHPDFRLFLTMDPRNGEISRAMRNRGVEIYLLNEEEGNAVRTMDVLRILGSIGLVNQTLQSLLLQIHNNINQEELVWEKHSLLDMYYGAYLCIQQMKFGCKPITSLRHSCIDTYVRSQRNNSQKQRILTIIEDVTNSHDVTVDCIRSPPSLILPSVCDFKKNSRLANVRSRAAVLVCLFRQWAYPEDYNDQCSWQMYVPVVDDVKQYVYHFLRIFLVMASKSDLKLQTNYLQVIMQKYCDKSECEILSFILKSHEQIVDKIKCSSLLPLLEHKLDLILNDFSMDSIDELPFDVRWYPSIIRELQSGNNLLPLTELFSLSNRFYLLVYFWIQKCEEDESVGKKLNCNIRKVNANKHYSALELSLAARKGKLTVEALPHPILIHISRFIEEIDSHFERLLSSDKPCSDDQKDKLLLALRWRHNFFSVASLKNAKLNLSTIVSYISLHWLWLKENVFPVLMAETNDKFPRDINAIISHMDQALINHLHPFHLRAEHLRSVLGSPLPFTTNNQAHLIQQIKSLDRYFEVTPILKSGINTKNQISIGILDSLHFKSYMVELMKTVLEKNVQEDLVQEEVNKIEEKLKQEVSLSHNNDDSTCFLEKFSINLWPCLETLNILLMSRLLKGISEDSSQAVIGELLPPFNRQALEIPTVTPSMVLLYAQMNDTFLKGMNLKHFFPEFLLNYCQRCLLSPASHKLNVWLMWEPRVERKDEQLLQSEEEKTELLPLEGPGTFHSSVQTYSMAHLLRIYARNVDWNEDFINQIGKDLQLRSYSQKIKQIKQFQKILWTNANVFTSHVYNLRENECHLLMNSLRALMNALDPSLIDKQLSIDGNIMDFCLTCSYKSHVKTLSGLDEELLKMLENACSSLCMIIHGNVNESEKILHLGKTWVFVGLLYSHLVGPMGPVDPIQKKQFLWDYHRDEIKDMEQELNTFNWISSMITGKNLQEIPQNQKHSHINQREERLEQLKEKSKSEEIIIAARPSHSQYESLVQEMKNYFSTLGKLSLIDQLMEELEQPSSPSSSLANTTCALRKYENWQGSIHSFFKAISVNYPMYKDVWMQLMAGVIQVSQGMALIAHTAKKRHRLHSLALKEDQLDSFFKVLFSFPSTGMSHFGSSLSQHLQELMSFATDTKLLKTLSNKGNGDGLSEGLLIAVLLEMKNLVIGNGTLNDEMRRILLTLLRHFVLLWQHQEDELKRRKIEEEHLYEYKTRTYCDELTEEEMEHLVLKRNFPLYSDEFKDYSDECGEDNLKFEEAHSSDNDPLTSIGIGMMSLIVKIHSQIFTEYSSSRWFQPNIVSSSLDYLRPFMLRYITAIQLLEPNVHLLGPSLDSQTLGSNILMSALFYECAHPHFEDVITETSLFHLPELLSKDKILNVYHDASVDEAEKCHVLLENLLTRVRKLLEEWPENACLTQIEEVVERIMSFSITSPLMKFITGLETVLKKSQDWETNAHKGISLRVHLEKITELVIHWRKLELKCWSSCLDSVTNESKMAAKRWWFHLFALIESYLMEDVNETEKNVSREEFLSAIETLMETSSLGEYSVRLEILFSFHCQLLHSKASKSRELINMTWNCYQYYKQFEEVVSETIDRQRKPIEKDVKNYIKIVRWNDLNFWAVKQSVEKSHRTLLKHMKQYQKILNQPVQSLLTDFTSTSLNRLHLSDAVNVSETFKLFLFSLSKSKRVLEHFDKTNSKRTTLSRLPKLYKKMKEITNDIFSKCSYFDQIESLNEMTGYIISSSDELQNLQINTAISEERRAAEARNIHHRKRKALSDLFKELISNGLSYRKGLVLWREGLACSAMLLPPVDVDISLKFLTEKQASDKLLLESWNGCLDYLYRCIRRLALLRKAAQSPHKDLSIQTIDRIIGFPSHLMDLICHQHRSIAEIDERLTNLRKNVLEVEKISSYSCQQFLPAQDLFENFVKEAQELTLQCFYYMQKLRLLLKVCPGEEECSNDKYHQNFPCSRAPAFTMNRNDSLWKKLNDILSLVVKQLEQVLQLLPVNHPSFKNRLYSWKDASLMDSVFTILMNVSVDIKEITTYFTTDDDNNCIPFLKDLSSFETCIKNLKNKYDSQLCHRHIQNDGDEQCEQNLEAFTDFIDKFIKKLLVSTQNLFSSIQEALPSRSEQTANNELVTLLAKNLSDNVKKMNLKNIEKLSSSLIKKLKKMLNLPSSPKYKEKYTKLLMKLHPFLSQYCLIIQYLFVKTVTLQRSVCKLNSTILRIFNELLQKGFCIPQEFSKDESSKDSGKFTDADGVGIGEGGGVKDVSDRIESEDQLDEMNKGEEQEKQLPEEQPQVQNEENAIEMSNEFDGKLHDLEDDEEDESGSDEEDENEELDKEMGKVGADEENLEEKIWGSDSEDEKEEDEDDEDKEKQTDYGGGDKSQMDENLVAKNDNEDKKEGEVGKENNQQEDIPFDERDYEDESELGTQDNGLQDEPAQPEQLELSEEMNLDEDEPEGDEAEAMQEENLEIGENNDKDENEENVPPENEDESPMEVENENPEGQQEDDHQSLCTENEEHEKDETISDQLEKEKEEKNNLDKESDIDKSSKQNSSVEASDVLPLNSTYDNVQQMKTSSSENTSTVPSSNTESDKNDSFGLAETEQSHGGGETVQSVSRNLGADSLPEEQTHRSKSNLKRTLGKPSGEQCKRLKTIENHQEEMRENPRDSENNFGNVYEHVQEMSDGDLQTRDAATLEQMLQQEDIDKQEDLENLKVNKEPDKSEDIQILEEKTVNGVTGDKNSEINLSEKDKGESDSMNVEIEGENVMTVSVQRSSEASFHTNLSFISDRTSFQISTVDLNLFNQYNFHRGNSFYGDDEAKALFDWHQLEANTKPLARELCEQLRLVLEPSLASKLQGDFRTGKRLNMRKVIPYVASQFRKDKIWLRRTKPSKRQYQIMLAVDDSSSMADNQVKQLAFESFSIISTALTLLDAGELAIAKFGETFELLHSFDQPFSDVSGARILRNFTFAQRKTQLAELLHSATDIMVSSKHCFQARNRLDISQLLVIISDGRGCFIEGETVVKAAVRKAHDAQIFTVFIILDMLTNKDSIFDIRIPVFGASGELPELKSYMDEFPFPFYIILREAKNLPYILSDALRQWFELVTVLH